MSGVGLGFSLLVIRIPTATGRQHTVHRPVHLESNPRVHGVDVSMTTPYTPPTLFGRGEQPWRH